MTRIVIYSEYTKKHYEVDAKSAYLIHGTYEYCGPEIEWEPFDPPLLLTKGGNPAKEITK